MLLFIGCLKFCLLLRGFVLYLGVFVVLVRSPSRRPLFSTPSLPCSGQLAHLQDGIVGNLSHGCIAFLCPSVPCSSSNWKVSDLCPFEGAFRFIHTPQPCLSSVSRAAQDRPRSPHINHWKPDNVGQSDTSLPVLHSPGLHISICLTSLTVSITPCVCWVLLLSDR